MTEKGKVKECLLCGKEIGSLEHMFCGKYNKFEFYFHWDKPLEELTWNQWNLRKQ